MALSKEEKAKIMSEYARGTSDTGSAEVQVALLTKNIRELTGHCQKNKKDFSGKRGLLKMVCRRRRLLRYLERVDAKRNLELVRRLELRK